MKQGCRKKFKNNGGITLIALAVTILVLIILAGVGISTIKGEDVTIVNANKAKFMTEVRDIQEQIELEEVKNNKGEDIQFATIKNAIGREDAYNEILCIENGNLVYDPNKVSERQADWLENMDIHAKENWIPIYTGEQLQKIASGEEVVISDIGGVTYTFAKDGKYLIQNDINLNGNDEKQWVPIEEFNGILDGQNKKISGLYLNGDIINIGMIKNNNGSVKNLKIDCDITEFGGIGTICVVNKGEISNIEINGLITATTTSAWASTAGICKINYGMISYSCNYATIIGKGQIVGGICAENNGIIEKTINYGIIQSGNSIVGGICGRNSLKVIECANFGTVSTNVWYTYDEGGIVGQNSGDVIKCYNLGNIGGTNERYMGGIVGLSTGIIKNCYSNAQLFGGYLGGIVARNSGNVENCYYVKNGNYDLQLSTSTGTVENSGEKTEEEMKQSEFLELLNQGEKVWKQSTNKNNGYPYLEWEDE